MISLLETGQWLLGATIDLRQIPRICFEGKNEAYLSKFRKEAQKMTEDEILEMKQMDAQVSTSRKCRAAARCSLHN